MPSRSVKYQGFVCRRRFGVEIEIGNEVSKREVHGFLAKDPCHRVLLSKYALTSNNNYWHVKDDATCGPLGRKGPKGVEIASYIGENVDDLLHIAKMAGQLQEFGCKVNENCGLHIHAEVLDLNRPQISAVIAHWIKFEHLLSLALPIRRRDNEFCRFTIHPHAAMAQLCGLVVRDQAYEPNKFYDLVMPKDIGFYHNFDRRFNLNLVNLARSVQLDNQYRRTLELRWPEGTLNPMDVRCWVRLFLAFIDRTRNLGMPRNLHPCDLEEGLSYLGLSHPTGQFNLWSSGMLETKTWLLERIVHFNNTEEHYSNHTVYAEKLAKDARKILKKMWGPVRHYG